MTDIGADIRKVYRSGDVVIFEVAPYQGADMRSCINAAIEVVPYCRGVGWRSVDMARGLLCAYMELVDGRYPCWR